MTKQFCIGCGLVLALAATEPLASDAIYRCIAEGRTVLTDRPRNDDCQLLTAPSSNIFKSEPAAGKAAQSSTLSQPHSQSKAGQMAKTSASHDDESAAERLKAKQRCERIEQRLNEIADKMRSGYTVRQGETLRMQRERLEASRRIERCR